ncbi:MAG TPA: tetratricopeptide repeat protein [Spirochaetota bacterium]|nr:tetratricopeptide repeat protein [Spirochaetota bacterium]
MKYVISIVMIFSFIVLARAQDNTIRVKFYVGTVMIDLSEKQKNTLPLIGHALPDSAVIRTAKASFIELLSGNRTVLVKENITVRVSDLARVKTGKDTLFNGLHTVVTKYIEPKSRISIASVRAEKTPDKTMVWEGDDDGAKSDYVMKVEEEAARDRYIKGEYEQVVSAYESEWQTLGYENCGFYAALSYLKLCRFDDARVIFETLQKSRDKDIAQASLFYTGVASEGQGKSSDAERIFRKYIDNNPEGEFIAAAYYLKGMSLARQGRKAEADEAFRYVLKKYPTDPTAEVCREAMTEQ